MAYRVAVRDHRMLEAALRKGEPLPLPDECRRNSSVIYEVLKQVYRVLPRFASLSETEIRNIADIASYAMRTDQIIRGKLNMVPPPHLPLAFGENGIFRNPPSDLCSSWEFRPENDEEHSRGAEFFRCYCCAGELMPGLPARLGHNGSFETAFLLSDVTTYLLNPNVLVDYRYTEQELKKFGQKLVNDLKSL
jgi:hypothetical protein